MSLDEMMRRAHGEFDAPPAKRDLLNLRARLQRQHPCLVALNEKEQVLVAQLIDARLKVMA